MERNLPQEVHIKILNDLLIGVNSEKKLYLAKLLCLQNQSSPTLMQDTYQIECVPNADGGRTLFDVVALEAIYKLWHLNSQYLSNMLWAYAKVGASHSALFMAAGDSIVALDSLSNFWPQYVSNIVWAYATAVEIHPRIFLNFANHIVFLATASFQHRLGVCNCRRLTSTAVQRNWLIILLHRAT